MSYDSGKHSKEIPPGFCVLTSRVVTYFISKLLLRVRLEHQV